MRTLVFCLCITGCAANCFGQGDPGTYKLTLGVNYSDRARKQPSFQDKEALPAELEYWFFKNFTMRLQSSLLISNNGLSPSERETGRGDAVVGGTFTFVDYDKDHPLGVQVDYQVKFPTAVKGLGTDHFDHQVLGIIYRNFLHDRLYGELDGGAQVVGQTGKSAASVLLFSLIETYGLVAKPGNPKSFRWTLYNETDYSPAAAGNPSSVTGLTQLVYVLNDKWTFKFGPNYAFTPYDSRFGFAIGVTYKGQLKRGKP